MQDALNLLNSLKLSEADLSRKLIKNGTLLPCTISEIKVTPNKTNTGLNMNLVLKTNAPSESTEDEVIHEGFTLYDTISLVQTEKYNPAIRVAELKLALTGEQSDGFVPANYIGHSVNVRVGIQEDKTDKYPPKNVVRYVKLAKN